MLTWSWGCKWC